MKHRKDKHPKTVKICSKFADKSCILNEERCWFKHEIIINEKEKNSEETNSVFWKRQKQSINP